MRDPGWLLKFLLVVAVLAVAGCATHSATESEIADLAEMQLQGARGIVHVKQTALCAENRGVTYCGLTQ